MKRKNGKFLCLLMVLVLCMGLLPAGVWGTSSASSVCVKVQNANNATGTVYYKWDSATVWTQLANTAGSFDINKPISNETAIGGTLHLKAVTDQYVGNAQTKIGEAAFTDDQLKALTSEQGLSCTVSANDIITVTIEFDNNGINSSKENGSDSGGGDGDSQPGNESTFSGTAYFVWDNSNSLGIKKITGLTGSGQSGGYEITYINASDFEFAEGVSVGSLAQNGHYFWVAADKVTVTNESNSESYSIQGSNNSTITTWSELESYINSLGEDGKRAFAYDPTGGRNGTHSISTNGDRNFRATIYESGFEGIQFSANMSDYTYFPGFWDPTFFSSTIDISGSTKANPAIYETYLREPNITFYNVTQSAFPITTVKALDVPNGVVTVAGNNSDGFTITFQSNYYDHVIFELTAQNDAKYYVMLARTVLQAHDNFGPNMTETPAISAEVWYPTDEKIGDDGCPYEVLAYVHYKNGSTGVQTLSAVQMPVTEGSSDMKFVLTPTEGAKALSYSTFTLPIGTAGQSLKDITVDAISYTVVKTGSGADFSGVMSGSGRGTYYDVNKRMIDYWK